MNLVDTFESPFKLIMSRRYSNPAEGLKVTFKTRNIYDETTKEEIYILSKMYFDNFVSQYKNYSINDRPTTESTYRLYVEKVEEGELSYKHVYSIAYNNIEDGIAWENKYDDNTSIEGYFWVGIDICAYVIEDYGEESENEEEVTIGTAITENECIVCLENKPNVLYTNCLHRCVCDSCDFKGEFSKCPMCRTKIKNQRIK